MPNATDTSDFARIHYLTIDEYVKNFELLRRFLNRDKVLNEFAKVDFRGLTHWIKALPIFYAIFDWS